MGGDEHEALVREFAVPIPTEFGIWWQPAQKGEKPIPEPKPQRTDKANTKTAIAGVLARPSDCRPPGSHFSISFFPSWKQNRRGEGVGSNPRVLQRAVLAVGAKRRGLTRLPRSVHSSAKTWDGCFSKTPTPRTPPRRRCPVEWFATPRRMPGSAVLNPPRDSYAHARSAVRSCAR